MSGLSEEKLNEILLVGLRKVGVLAPNLSQKQLRELLRHAYLAGRRDKEGEVLLAYDKVCNTASAMATALSVEDKLSE